MKPHFNLFRFAELDTCYVVTVVTNNANNVTNLANNNNNNDDGMNSPATASNQSMVMPMICPTKMRVYIIQINGSLSIHKTTEIHLNNIL